MNKIDDALKAKNLIKVTSKNLRSELEMTAIFRCPLFIGSWYEVTANNTDLGVIACNTGDYVLLNPMLDKVLLVIDEDMNTKYLYSI